jgi:HAMP domain-containing protein
VALVVLLSTVFQVLFALHASNRLAGPMLRLRRILAEMAAGNTSQRATFRKRDRLEDLAEPVNRRLVLLDDALSRLKGELPFLASSVQTFRADLENGKYPLDADELRRLEATLGNLAGFWRRGAEPTEP